MLQTKQIEVAADVKAILDAANNAAIKALLDLEIGTDVQAYSARLGEIAALTPTDSNIIVGNGSGWVAESGATARTSLGLGSLATASTISNSDWSGTDLSVANGGTGVSTITGVIKGNGTSAFSAATAGTDFLSPGGGGTLTAAINLGENAGFELDSALSADGKYSSNDVIAGTAGATLAFGDVCYLNDTDGRWELADANLSDGYDCLLGICVLAAASDGSATKMMLQGTIRADTAFPTLTIGKPVYLSETAGDVVVTQPTTASVAIRFLGHALTADSMWFSPDNIYFTHT